MKKLFFLLIVICQLCLASCEEVDFNRMPTETQTGKGTFGCYVDGNLFVGPVYGFKVVNTAKYDTINKKLEIVIRGKINNKKFGDISLLTDNIEINKILPLSVGIYSLKDSISQECLNYMVKNGGNIIFTRFDTEKNIVSGRFNLTGICMDYHYNPVEGNVVQITDGRFDLKLVK
ncbi:exported hypothetical protein [uncultured Paludibacter sp.]|uniref:Lipoprotein n=1 Tax=uncultured Paludibacter sp. TaxID=497635 RepID=A0A653AAP2_9BACT|nr:exported hypothetical protein [uncultured Paludibacter sp.]